MAKLTKAQQAARDESLAWLRERMPPGTTVHTVLRNVSRSGMQRVIGVVLIDRDGDTLHPNHHVAIAIGARADHKRDGIVMGGCGMDMGFHLVNSLSYALHGYGDDETRVCPKCSAAIGVPCIGERFDYHGTQCLRGEGCTVSHQNRRAGYTLNHRWI